MDIDVEIDEAHFSQMQERGATAWSGVDPQALREGGSEADAIHRLAQITRDLAVVLPVLGSAAMLCNRRTQAGRAFRAAHDRLAALVLA